jgi:type III secretion protein J
MYRRFLPLVLLMFSGCLKHELQTGLSEQEAQEIIVLLREHGIEATKELQPGEVPTWKVYVKGVGGSQNLFLAWRILQENGLPREKTKGLDAVFAGSGLIPTASEEKARLIKGLSGEISRTLQSVEGIVDARVHVVLPDNSPLLEKSERRPTTASVLVKYQGSQTPLREDAIKRLVANGVEGLLPEYVALVFKKIEPKHVPPRDVGWYLRDRDITIASLAVLGLTNLGSLALVLRGRRQRMLIERLQRQVQPAAESRHLTAENK